MEMENLIKQRHEIYEKLVQMGEDLKISDENCVQVLPMLKERLNGVKEGGSIFNIAF